MPKFAYEGGEINYEIACEGHPLIFVSGLNGVARYWQPQVMIRRGPRSRAAVKLRRFGPVKGSHSHRERRIFSKHRAIARWPRRRYSRK